MANDLNTETLHSLNTTPEDHPTYAILRDTFCNTNQAKTDASPCCVVEGQVVNLRRLSKKRIFFLDLQLLQSTHLPPLSASSSSSFNTGDSSSIIGASEVNTNCACCQYLPGLFRFDEIPLATLQACYRRSKLGDVVRISGFLERVEMEQQSSDNECEAKPHEAPPAQDTEQRLESGQEVSHRPTKEGTRTTSVEPSLTTLCLANTDTLPPADLGNVLVPSLPTPAITPLVIVEKRRHIPVPLPSLITPTVCASSASLQLQQRSRFILHGIDLTVVRQWDRDTQGEFIPVHVASPASMKKKRQRDDDNESTCKFWVNTGRCDKGEACAFVHVRGENKMKAARREWVEKRNRLRQLLTHDPFDPHPILSKKSRHQRASIFANFLVEKFGVPFLNSGSGVLDVAGGKGDIELELTRLGIRCTLVEPRDDVWEEAGDERIRKKKNGKEVRLKKDKKKIHGHGGPEPHNLFFTHLNTILPPADDPAFPLDPPLAEALRTCSILIGLHPDAATDSIVDHALANEKSFAIIPCCVFKHTNEERRQWKENGAEREVSTYEDLCEYLYWKVRTVSGNTRTIKREWVEFVGRNTVLLGRVE